SGQRQVGDPGEQRGLTMGRCFQALQGVELPVSPLVGLPDLMSQCWMLTSRNKRRRVGQAPADPRVQVQSAPGGGNVIAGAFRDDLALELAKDNRTLRITRPCLPTKSGVCGIIKQPTL